MTEVAEAQVQPRGLPGSSSEPPLTVDASKVTFEAGSPDFNYTYGTHMEQGKRSSMLDRLVTRDVSTHPALQPCHRALILAVCDGHVGEGCVEFLEQNVADAVLSVPSIRKNPKAALTTAVTHLEQQLHTRKEETGSTLLLCLLLDNMVYIASVGDCRALLSLWNPNDVAHTSVQLTRDHRAEEHVNKDEFERVRKGLGQLTTDRLCAVGGGPSGGDGDVDPVASEYYVDKEGFVGGEIQVSRTLGDYSLKQKYLNVLISTPEVVEAQLDHHHEFLLLSSDGLFSTAVDNRQVINWVRAELSASGSTEKAAQVLVTRAEAKSTDNVSAIVVWLSSRPLQQRPSNSRLRRAASTVL